MVRYLAERVRTIEDAFGGTERQRAGAGPPRGEINSAKDMGRKSSGAGKDGSDGDGPRGMPTGAARGSAHELARYEALFAARTRGMKSSAMREMMALTERPDVISLAGGLPDTTSFSPRLYAQLMARVSEQTARALQYGPTEGMQATVRCIVEVMAAEGAAVDPAEVIVTTGGQQVLDLVCKTLIDPGDVIVAEAPTYPGAVPTFSAYEAHVEQIDVDADGLPMDELERTLDRLQAAGRRPKFIYTVPNFQNPAGVTMSLARRRRLVQVARERELMVLEDNPYGLLRYEGEALPTLYSLDAAAAGRGGGADLVVYLGTFSKILSPGLRLGWAVAPRPVLEKLNIGKQGADLCCSPVTQMFVAAYFDERERDGIATWQSYVGQLVELYARRRDAMLEALAESFGEHARWTEPRGGLFVWVTLDERIDTTDLLALARESEGVAFVPGRAAYVDGRSGANAMRLNFAGVPEAEFREGVRRIGRAVREQLVLLGSLGAGAPPARLQKEPAAPPAGEAGLADVVALPRRGMSRIALLQGGRSLERGVSLRSGAHVLHALRRLGHEVTTIDAGADLVARLKQERPDAAFIALHGRDGEDGTVQGLLEAVEVPYTGSGPAACMCCTDKVLAKHLMRAAGIPTPEFRFLRETAIKELGGGGAIADVGRQVGFPMVVKPAVGGSALGVKFARAAEQLPGALVGALSYDSTVVLERYVAGRDLAVSIVDGADGEPIALPVVEAVPREEEFYDYESRYEIGMTTFVCPADLEPETTARAKDLAIDVYRLLRCRGVARIDMLLDRDSDALWVLETNVVPGMTDTSLLPQAADAAGIGFDELVETLLAAALAG
jgi:2-aminoadipate transaminase